MYDNDTQHVTGKTKYPVIRRGWAIFLIALITFAIGIGIGSAGNSASTVTNAAPGPTVTATVPGPDTTQTVTATPTANAQGKATQISASGVYIVGSDIPAGGAWHTTGSPDSTNCYYARLSSTDTSDIIDNNDFTGPETVDITSGTKGLEIDGDCTWDYRK